jgi:hypothetical protein
MSHLGFSLMTKGWRSPVSFANTCTIYIFQQTCKRTILSVYFPSNTFKLLKGKKKYFFIYAKWKEIVTRDVKTVKRNACGLIHLRSFNEKVFVEKNVGISCDYWNNKRCTGRACEKKNLSGHVEGMNYSPVIPFVDYWFIQQHYFSAINYCIECFSSYSRLTGMSVKLSGSDVFWANIPTFTWGNLQELWSLLLRNPGACTQYWKRDFTNTNHFLTLKRNVWFNDSPRFPLLRKCSTHICAEKFCVIDLYYIECTV